MAVDNAYQIMLYFRMLSSSRIERKTQSSFRESKTSKRKM